MGLFSWRCEVCGVSLRSILATDKLEEIESVALLESGSIIIGAYDGYGRIEEADIADKDPQVYHKKCWEKAGKPTEYRGASKAAEDQGFFY
jgi:hypothetical protein